MQSKTNSPQYLSSQPARNAPGPKPARKLYSMAAVMRERSFAGSFETSRASYEFLYQPATARLANNRLELTGTLRVTSTRGVKREAGNVRARLASTQGGLGTVPSVIQQRARMTSSLPLTEATDESGFVGVLYFSLSGINARSLGLSLDLSKVQLNARLYPTSETERQLQVIYSDLVATVYGEKPDLELAQENLKSLNRLLAQG